MDSQAGKLGIVFSLLHRETQLGKQKHQKAKGVG